DAGLPAMAVAWGAIGDVGYLARNSTVASRFEGRVEAAMMTAEEALRHLEVVLARPGGPPPVVTIAPLDWPAMSRVMPALKRSTFGALATSADGVADDDRAV